MPSFTGIVETQKIDGDILKINGQRAKISLPPLMKVAEIADASDGDLEVLPAEAGKSYIIHGYRMLISNTAVTTATVLYLRIYDYNTGAQKTLEIVGLNASQVNRATASLSGLNIPTHPGKKIVINSDAVPAYRSITLYYTEVDV